MLAAPLAPHSPPATLVREMNLLSGPAGRLMRSPIVVEGRLAELVRPILNIPPRLPTDAYSRV